MIKRRDGFTLTELMITMVIFVLVIAAASNIFSGLVTQFKQQSKIAETNIEGIAGLELMRFDIEQAGYGLPWNVDANGDGFADADWTNLANYKEAVSTGSPDPANYNDADDATGTGGNAPRAIVCDNNVGYNNSDYLVIKATNIATNDTAQKWTYIANAGSNNTLMTQFGSSAEDLVDGERVIVTIPSKDDSQKILLTDDTSGSRKFFASFDTDLTTFTNNYADLVPFANSYQTHLIYGVDDNTDLRMPFNRADFFIERPSSIPSQCAPNTGVLYKTTVNHKDGKLSYFPLLDCVADMQITFRLDMNDDGTAATISDANGTTINNTTEGVLPANVQETLNNAALIRQRLKEIRVYILAHEGQKDATYTFNNFTGMATCPTCITVGNAAADDNAALTKDFDLSIIPEFRNYRWKVYSMSIIPYNLR